MYLERDPEGTWITQSVGILFHALLLATVGGVVRSKRISPIPQQLANALAAILVTPLGIVIEVREGQLENALPPILVTPLGIVIESREEQLANV